MEQLEASLADSVDRYERGAVAARLINEAQNRSKTASLRVDLTRVRQCLIGIMRLFVRRDRSDA